MRKWLNKVVFGLIIFILVFPFIHMFLMSIKPATELFSTFFNFKPTISNYYELFRKVNLGRYITNSFVISGSAGLLSVLLGSLAAYSFARYKFFAKKPLLFLILFTRMMPPIGAVVPLFLIIKSWNLADTHIVLILLYVAFQTPFVIWMMRSFFMSIPEEVEESALIDGCNRLNAFFRITLPLAAPGIVATTVFAFILSWNEFLYALIFTTQRAKTAPVVVPDLIGEMGIYWGQICGAGIMIVIPAIIFASIVQRNLVRGLTFGAVKG